MYHELQCWLTLLQYYHPPLSWVMSNLLLPAPSSRSKSIISFLPWKPQSARRFMLYVTPLFSMRRQVSKGGEDPPSDSFISWMACSSLEISPFSIAYQCVDCVCLHVCVMKVKILYETGFYSLHQQNWISGLNWFSTIFSDNNGNVVIPYLPSLIKGIFRRRRFRAMTWALLQQQKKWQIDHVIHTCTIFVLNSELVLNDQGHTLLQQQKKSYR